MLARGQNGVHLEHVQRMSHRSAQRMLVVIVAAVKMEHHTRAPAALSRDRQVGLAGSSFRALGDFAEELSLEMRQLGFTAHNSCARRL